MTETNQADYLGDHPGRRRLEEIAFAKGDGPHVAGAAQDVLLAHVRECETCIAVIAKLREERAAFLAARPPDKFVRDIAAHTGREAAWYHVPDFLKPQVVIPAAAVVVLTLALSLLYSTATVRSPELDDTTFENRITLKGARAGSLTLFVSRNGAPAVPHERREPLREKDVVKFGIRSENTGWVTIANLDDQGRATVYLSAAEEGKVRAGDSALKLLKDSIVLDGFLGTELIVALVSKAPLDSAAVEKALEKAYRDADGRLDRIRTLDMTAAPLFYLIKKTN